MNFGPSTWNDRFVRAASVLLCVLGVNLANAQELEPRQYSNIPVGLNFFAAGYGTSQGNVLFDPAVALDNADIEIDGPAFGYARSLAVGGFSGKFDAGAAHVCLLGTADYQGVPVARNVCGWTDARMRLSVNFLGAPARRLSEFAGYEQDLIVGASIAISAPTGRYDADRLVNIGTNRLAIKAEIGMSKALRRWSLEFALASTSFETNDNFFGGSTQEQASIQSLQTHAIRQFPNGIWIALDSTRYKGGQTRTNGVANGNEQSNSRLGMTVSLPINRRQSVKLYFSSGLSTRTGTDFDTLGAVWQYRWGGGL